MALAYDFSFQLGNAGMILNDNSPTAYPTIDIHSIKGLDSAPVRQTVKDREGTNGAYVDAEFDQARTVQLGGFLYDDALNTEVTLDRLKSEWAPSRVPVPFYYRFPKVGERMLWVKPVGCNYDIDQLRRLGMCEVTFTAIAGDPRIYAAMLTTANFGVTDLLQTGFGFNRAFNFGFGGVTTNSTPALIMNYGNRSTPAKYRMYGPYLNPHIVINGSEMVFDMAVLNAGDYLEVDTSTHTVRFVGPYGVQNRRDTLRRPNWVDLQPGQNVVSFRVEGLAGLPTHMEIDYRSAWR
jgi:hypothetical protein